MGRSVFQRFAKSAMQCAVAILIGLVTVALVNADLVFTGGSIYFQEEWVILSIQVIMVAAPFAVLAIIPNSGRAAWLTAVALTAVFWALPVLDQVARRGEGGANIGLGLVMLLSPLLVLGGAFAAKGAVERRRL